MCHMSQELGHCCVLRRSLHFALQGGRETEAPYFTANFSPTLTTVAEASGALSTSVLCKIVAIDGSVDSDMVNVFLEHERERPTVGNGQHRGMENPRRHSAFANQGYGLPSMETAKRQKHTTGGIPRWSPTLVLVARFSAYVWQSGRDAQFSLTYGRMC